MRPALFEGLGLLLIAVLLFPGTLAGESMYDRDIHAVWLAQVAAFRDVVRTGWPLWNPFVGFGEPMLANPTQQLLYPPTWLQLLLPASTFYMLSTVGHLAWAGAGVRRLAANLGLGRPAAALAGAIFMASGPLLSIANVWHHFAGFCWMPWVLAAGDRAMARPGWPRAVLWGTAAGVQVLAGSPDAVLLTTLGTAVLAGRHLVPPRTQEWLVRARVLALAVLTTLLLAAGQWVPSLELASRSARADLSHAVQASWSLHPLALAQLTWPVYFNRLTALSPTAAREFELASPFLTSVYLSLPAVGLVIAALARTSARWTRYAAALLVLCVLLALGRHLPVHEVATTLLPPLGMLRYPVKFTILGALAWSLLCGAGLALWQARARLPRAAAHGLGVASTAALLAALLLPRLLASAHGLFAPAPGVDVWALTEPVRQALARAGVLGLAVLGCTFLRASWAPYLAAVACIVDLLSVHQPLNPTVSTTFFRWRPEVLAKLEPRDGEAPRVFVWDYRMQVPGLGQPHASQVRHLVDVQPGLPPSLATAMAFQAYLYPPAAGRWGVLGSFDDDLLGMRPATLDEAAHAVRATEGSPAHLRLLQLGGVHYVLSLHDPDVRLVRVASVASTMKTPILLSEVPSPLPWAFAVTGSRRAPAGEGVVAALTHHAFDARREVLLEQGPERPATGPGAVSVVRRSAAEVELDVTLPAPGHVVLLQAWDPGWRAQVDGARAEVVPANVIFQGIAVPAGRHRVTVAYRPTLTVLALWVTVVATAGVVLAAWYARAAPTGSPLFNDKQIST